MRQSGGGEGVGHSGGGEGVGHSGGAAGHETRERETGRKERVGRTWCV